MTDPFTSPRLTPQVRDAWERNEAAACSNCGAVPDDWVCEPNHCHSCTATYARVVVDDMRVYPFEATYLRTLENAQTWFLENIDEVIDELYLDHDLGYREVSYATGPIPSKEDVRPLVAGLEHEAAQGWPRAISRVYVVTDNPVGYKWITAGLERFYDVRDGRGIPHRVDIGARYVK